jgi:hypothetical protein
MASPPGGPPRRAADEPAQVVSGAAHERYAVSDGPNGTRVVVAPAHRMLAADVKALNHRFWCSTAANGCGSRLSFKVGKIRTPHFAHYAGERPNCTRADTARLISGYQHLAMQLALQAWLERLGHDVTLERVVVNGRVDLHVVADGVVHVLEVQRSPLPVEQWVSRDALYRQTASTVTWLFDQERRGEADVALATRGVAFHTRVSSEMEVEVGTLWVDEGGTIDIGWDRLDECLMDAHGLRTPHREFALASTREWREMDRRKQAAERAREEQQQSAHDERRLAAQARRHRAIPARQKAPPSSMRDQHLLAVRRQRCPELDGWNPPQGWQWLEELPAHLHESARHLAYYVARLYSAGPASDLAWHDMPDHDGLQREALVSHGFVTLTDEGSKWRRRVDA